MPTTARMLHVATRFARGGSEQRIVDVIQALDSSRFEHHVVVGGGSEANAVAARLGVARVVLDRHLVRSPNPILDTVETARLIRLIKELEPTIVHTCQSKAGALGRFAAAICRVPIVVHSLSMANFGPSFGRLSAVYEWVERLLGSRTNAYLVVGADLRDRYLRAGISTPARYHVIRSSLPVDALRARMGATKSELRRALGLPADVPVFAYVGSLERRKGVTELPRILASVRKRVPGAILVIAGAGAQRAAIEESLSRDCLTSQVVWLGHTGRVPDLLAATDCIVLPSRAEGVSQVLVQAAGLGTPFAAYAVDGPGELMKMGALGTIVQNYDPRGLADAVCGYLSGSTPRRAKPIDLAQWRSGAVQERYREVFDSLLKERTS